MPLARTLWPASARGAYLAYLNEAAGVPDPGGAHTRAAPAAWIVLLGGFSLLVAALAAGATEVSFGPQQVITTQADGAPRVYAADLDGDGDPDVLSASVLDDKIAWYENLDGLGTFGPQQIITTQADWANSVFAADLDGDGDPDVLSASMDDDKIAWYENLDGLGTFGPQQVITTQAVGASNNPPAEPGAFDCWPLEGA